MIWTQRRDSMKVYFFVKNRALLHGSKSSKYYPLRFVHQATLTDWGIPKVVNLFKQAHLMRASVL